VATLSVVIPHWPLDEETNEALRSSVSSFPPECEGIVVVNDGTGYGHNVNIGLGLASGVAEHGAVTERAVRVKPMSD
jgi:hypothetical protein